LKAQNKNIVKVVIFSILLVSYLLGFIMIFNIRDVLGIGHYQGEKNFTVDINGSSCGLHVELWARHRSQLEHYYGYSLTEFSNGDVNSVGISNVSFTVKTGTSVKQVIDQNLEPPRKSYSSNPNTITRLHQNDNLTIKGYADIILLVNNNNVTYRIPINLGIIITLDGNAINYEWGNITTWLETIYLSLSVIPALLLYRIIKEIRFNKWYNEKIKSDDKEFLKKLKEKKQYE